MKKESIHFTKMHGAGNDYVYLYGYTGTDDELARLARFVSDRHKGIGSDGLVLIEPAQEADFAMRIFNADGSEAEMCGNASRCVGKLVYEQGHTRKQQLTLATRSGIKELELHLDGRQKVESVTVQMGPAHLQADEIPVACGHSPVVDEPIEVAGEAKKMTCVSMGNPHAVYFVDNVASLDLEKIGPAHERHPRFPRRTNSEFVELVDDSHIKMRVWERGAGETQACGTGACASAVACILNGKTGPRVQVELPGGTLTIEWQRQPNRVYMTGPAATVFEGTLEWPQDDQRE